MPRPRRAGRTRRETITEGEVLWAYDQLTPAQSDHYATQFFTPEARFREVWEELREEVLDAWIAANPGTRPSRWWGYDSPEPRRRVGGTGTPAHEVLNYTLHLDRGIPSSWVGPFEVDYYNGRAKNIHGHRIGTEYSEGSFPYAAIDRRDPPLFESEAVYLDRLGLLGDEERARLDTDAWEPEAVLPHDDESDAEPQAAAFYTRPALRTEET